MAVQVSIIAAVAVLRTVDLTIQTMAFPAEFAHTTQKVEFDYVEGSQAIALKGNFAKQANVVPKKGFKTITVNPMQVNESVVDSPANFGKKRIGQTIYGNDLGGLTEAERLVIEDQIEKFGLLKNRKDVLLKKSIYDVLTTGKVIVSGVGDATDEIDYGMTNKIVNDNATAGSYQWNDHTNSFPVEQLETVALGMGQFAPNTFVLGSEARIAWTRNPNVRTVDNTTTGQAKNFNAATETQSLAKSTEFMIYLGRTSGASGVPLEIYAETEKYDDTTPTDYLNKNFVVGFRNGNTRNGQVQYGAIPVATGDGVGSDLTTFVGMEWIDAEIEKDPAGVKRYYRSSPLPTMNVPKAFVSIKATLIA